VRASHAAHRHQRRTGSPRNRFTPRRCGRACSRITSACGRRLVEKKTPRAERAAVVSCRRKPRKARIKPAIWSKCSRAAGRFSARRRAARMGAAGFSPPVHSYLIRRLWRVAGVVRWRRADRVAQVPRSSAPRSKNSDGDGGQHRRRARNRAAVIDQIALVIRFFRGLRFCGRGDSGGERRGYALPAHARSGDFKDHRATRRQVVRIFSVEFLALGLVAGLMGAISRDGVFFPVTQALAQRPFSVRAEGRAAGRGADALLANAAGWWRAFGFCGRNRWSFEGRVSA